MKLPPLLIIFTIGPLLGVLLCIGWVLFFIASIALSICLWPFRIISGVIYSILGGGK